MFWDQVTGVYDGFVNVINRKTQQRWKQIPSELIDPEDVVLECACGTGFLSAGIAASCRRLTATELSRTMLRKAKKNCGAFPRLRSRTSPAQPCRWGENRTRELSDIQISAFAFSGASVPQPHRTSNSGSS